MKMAMKAMKKVMKKDFEQRAMAKKQKINTCKMSIKPICGTRLCNPSGSTNADSNLIFFKQLQYVGTLVKHD